MSMDIQDRWAARRRAWRVWFCVVLPASTGACQADAITGVQCGDNADCGLGSACVEFSCQPAAIVVRGRDGGVEGLPAGTLLDDFEHPSGFPSDARFGSWIAGLYVSDDCRDGQTGRATAELVDGRLEFDWSVSDTRDGRDCFPTAGVTSTPVLAVIDLTAYDRIRFTLAHEPADPACATATQASIVLRCDPTVYSYVFPAPDAWETFTVVWENFLQPEWVPPNTVALEDCLRRVQNITFGPIPNMRDGQCQAGTFRIDSVWLGAATAE